jgi:trehalose 6-phosphate synthase
MRLVTCSNSAPRLTSYDGALKPSPAVPGGLVPILAALLEEVGGHWIFTSQAETTPMPAYPPSLSSKDSSWQPLHIDKRLLEEQRESITIRTLLWLFHYLHDTSTEPTFDDAIQPAWQAYSAVNQRFADALLNVHENANDEVVLINDFHLMLTPSMFASKVQARNSQLAYFHHVPWCEPDYFAILPEWMRTQILESLLSCDFVGFHCDRWGNAFLACCDRFLADANVADRAVAYRDHETRVTTAPGPIDADVLDELRNSSATEEWREKLSQRAAGRRIITRVDRLDLWKNIVRGFSAHEKMLAGDTNLAAEIWFCAIVSLPRLLTSRHDRYRALCEDAVKRINDRFAAGREVVSMVYPDDAGSQRNRAVAALSLGSATLVNPTYDGLNMVAKEAIIVNPQAPLVLSKNAGAYPQLAGASIPIQPFDLMSTAEGLRQAIEDVTIVGKQEIKMCVTSLRRERPVEWLQAILTSQQTVARTAPMDE